MKLPNGEHAVVDIATLRDYCLNTDHPRGRNKARVFASALGLTTEHAEELRGFLLDAARTDEAELAEKDEFGQRFVVDLTVHWQGKHCRVRSAWIVRLDEDFPRLTSCYVDG